MIDLKTLLATDPQELAELQHDMLKKHAIDTLLNMVTILKEESYETILTDFSTVVTYSPAGDGYGTDSHYINFAYGGDSLDIHDIAEALKSLKGLMKEGETKNVQSF